MKYLRQQIHQGRRVLGRSKHTCFQVDGYIAGVDYPAYESVPKGLSFKCRNRLPGYYADTETRCQVWHWCLHSGHQYSFICPNGTVFNQAVRVCDWWTNVNCPVAEQFLLSQQRQNSQIQQQAKQQQQRQQQQQLQYAQQQQRQRRPKEFQMEDGYYDAREINGLSEPTISEYPQMRFNKQLQAQRQQQQQQRQQQNSLLTTHNLPKSSFRGNIKYSQKNSNNNNNSNSKYNRSNSNKNTNNNYQYNKSSSNNRDKNNQNNFGFSISSQNNGSNDRNFSSRNQNNHSNSHSDNNSSQGKQNKNKSSPTNANNLDNDELKDYKSKIKNKYNIDYDHSLDEEYEIIEAIE
ncbi:unnamed protein product [Ceratitis capitata]|uniref:(Mediterranean fruit fly) hypothetical protein n=2 Tax=Ceratitis capitata TaxID=7213 RepID=A0A811UZU4_CERCA|nr:unnamed protein product [Ceratitis capitata]